MENVFSFQCNIGSNSKPNYSSDPVIPILGIQNNIQDEPQEGPIQSMQNTNGGTTTFAASKDNEGHGTWTPLGFKG